MLFGLLFFAPFLGAAIGAAMGAISGSFSDVGINDRFIDEVKAKVIPGTSALFLMSSNAVIDRVTEAFKGQNVEWARCGAQPTAFPQRSARRWLARWRLASSV